MGEGQEHVNPCPAHKDTETGIVTVAIEMTEKEVEAVRKHKTILFNIHTYNQPMQPFNVWVEDEHGERITDERTV